MIRSSEHLRVLVVGAKWPPETFLRQLFDGLLDRGLEITLAVPARPDEDWMSRPMADWLELPRGRGPRGALAVARAILGNVRFPFRTLRDAMSFRPMPSQPLGPALRRTLPYVGRRWDVVYFPWTVSILFHKSLVDLGMPVLLSCRGSQVNIAPYGARATEARARLASAFSQATLVHCVSEAIMDESFRFGLEPSKAEVIRPAVDTSLFKPAGATREGEPFVVTTTGSLIWSKGYEFALMAIARLIASGRQLRFDIIGSGPERERVLFTAHELGISPHVRLLGSVSRSEVIRHLQSSHVFILSSLSEGISNAVLEAMSCGLPVVTTDCGGMKEVVREGIDGYLVPVRDPVLMATRIDQLLENPGLRDEMATAARDRVISSFRLEDQITSFADLIRRTASMGQR